MALLWLAYVCRNSICWRKKNVVVCHAPRKQSKQSAQLTNVEYCTEHTQVEGACGAGPRSQKYQRYTYPHPSCHAASPLSLAREWIAPAHHPTGISRGWKGRPMDRYTHTHTHSLSLSLTHTHTLSLLLNATTRPAAAPVVLEVLLVHCVSFE